MSRTDVLIDLIKNCWLLVESRRPRKRADRVVREGMIPSGLRTVGKYPCFSREFTL